MIKDFLETEKIYEKYKDEFTIRLLSCCISPCYKDYLKMPKKIRDKELSLFMDKIRKSNLLSQRNLSLLKRDYIKTEKTGPKDEAVFVKKAYNLLFAIRNNYKLISFLFQSRVFFSNRNRA